MKKETIEEPKQELELKDFDNADILDVLNMGNVEYLGNGDIIYNPNLFFVKRGDKWFIKTEKPKQETIEEAAKEYAKQHALSTRHISHIGFEDGAKWQSERMYSEEDMEEAFTNGLNRSFDSDFDRWFEQFKSK